MQKIMEQYLTISEKLIPMTGMEEVWGSFMNELYCVLLRICGVKTLWEQIKD